MNGAGLVLIVLAFFFLYLVVVRPQRRRQTVQQELIAGLEVGDEVVTAGGIFGEIVELGEEELLLEIAAGVRVRVARRAVGGVVAHDDEGDGDEPAAAVEDPPDGGGEAAPAQNGG